MKMTFKQRMAIQRKNEKRIKEICYGIMDISGIYVLTREEDGIKYAYVGQAKRLITRLAQHLSGYEQHIDRSLKDSARGLYSETNKGGWKIEFSYCPVEMLNSEERKQIQLYAKTHQMYNKTIGGQDEGKKALGEAKSPKGYRDGLKQGYKNAQRDVSKLFEKNLTYEINGKPNKLKERALEKFKEFLLTKDSE